MIVRETITINGKDYIRTYSDSGYLIHGGVPESNYSEAVDPAEFNRTYVETNIPDEGDHSGDMDPADVVERLEEIL